MIPAYKYNLIVTKKDKWPELCDRVASVLEEAGGSPEVTDFYFEESNLGKHVALKRLYSTCEAFRTFELERTRRHDDKPHKVVSSFLYNDPGEMDAETRAQLSNVLPRIGRSLPFHRTLFVFEGIPWSARDCEIEVTIGHIVNREIPRNCVFMCNDWWVSGREVWLIAMVLPDVGDDALILPAKASEFIDTLGRVRNRELIVFPEADEERVKVHAAIDREHEFVLAMKRLGDDLMKAGKLHPKIGNDLSDRQPGFSRKKIIQSAVRDLGFRSVAAKNVPGYIHFSKRTERNNAVRLGFDFGSWLPQCSAWITVEGPLWSYTLNFPHVNYSSAGEISTPEEFGKSIDNMRAELEAAQDIFDEIEGRHDISPAWFRPYDM